MICIKMYFQTLLGGGGGGECGGGGGKGDRGGGGGVVGCVAFCFVKSCSYSDCLFSPINVFLQLTVKYNG